MCSACVVWAQYSPEGRAIVCTDGVHRYTRALYGGPDGYRVETSDRPVFALFLNSRNARNVSLRLEHEGRWLALDSTEHCKAVYGGGKRSYQLTDAAWKGGELTMEVYCLSDRDGALWHIRHQIPGGRPTLEVRSTGVKNKRLSRNGDIGVDSADSFESDGETIQLLSQCVAKDIYIAADSLTLRIVDEEEAGALLQPTLDYYSALENRIVFDTPDAYINPLGSALVLAADGAWDGRTWQHGAVGWRTSLAGWRGGYLGDVLGWWDRSRSHFNAYAESQVKNVPPREQHPTQDSTLNLARAVKRWGTQMYSDGYISRRPGKSDEMTHYDMNLNCIDELLWHFEYDADTAYMRQMWPMLVSHLRWEKRNFDPDDDGLYDGYCCIWASDALYYSGGAVTHSSAYNYRGMLLAGQIAELIGEDGSWYRSEAEKTLKAMNERLWMSDSGHWAEYADLMGLGRVHEHAALWSVYTPIDCGAATEAQAFRATQYADVCLPHIPVAPGLQTISTTDWMPYEWSINNVAAAEVMHTALACFEAGNSEMGFRLLKANVMDQMYLGSSPGNFGQISQHDAVRGECYRDFADCTGIAARALLQGLFGIVPDALRGRCVIRPGFPTDWDHASVSTPYITYSYRREGDKEVYEVEQRFNQPLEIILRQNTGFGFVETVGTNARKQTFVVERPPRMAAPTPIAKKTETDGCAWGNGFSNVEEERLEPVPMERCFNSRADDIFKNEYLSPRPPYTTLQIPKQGVGDWCHPETCPTIDDSGLRRLTTDGILNVRLTKTVRHCLSPSASIFNSEAQSGSSISATDSLIAAIPFRMASSGNNIAYTTLWDNYPDAITLPLKGKASHAYLLMAGSTNHMQSHIDNGIIVVGYTDGTSDSLRLRNPHNWCPIEQDYYENGLAFHAAQPRPFRIDFETGRTSRELIPMGPRYGERRFSKGAGIVLDMPLNPRKRLKDLTVRTLSNDVVIGLMGVTLQRTL